MEQRNESFTGQTEPASQLLTFMSGRDCFALEIKSIREIIEFDEVTRVPLMPLFIRGVINLRGAVVPVIDLKARLFGQEVTAGKRTCVVVVELQHDDGLHELGVLVDAVNEVIDLGSNDRTDAPQFGHSIRADFIDYIAKVNEKLIIVLALAKVLSIDEMASLVSLAEQCTEDRHHAAI